MHTAPSITAALLFTIALAGCGGGSHASAAPGAGALTGFLPAVPMASDQSVVFLIRPTVVGTGTLTVRFIARQGTPFFDGSTDRFDAAARFELPNQIRGTLPAVRVPAGTPAPIDADVILLGPGQVPLGSDTFSAQFLPLPPPPPPTVTGVQPGLLLSGTPTCLRVVGTRFEPVGAQAVADLVASSGTPFLGGTSATLSVPVTIESETAATGLLPGLAFASDVTAFVTLHLPSGASPTSTTPIASLGSERKLLAPDAATFDYFGTSLALSGELAVVGARLHDAGADKTGAAYIFVRQGQGWVMQQKLTAPDAAAGDEFGTSVAIQGQTVAIGSPLHDSAASNGGAVYVFVRSGGTWQFEQKLTASDAASGDHLGESVALHGDVLAGGAPDDNNGGGTDAGSVYTFTRSSGVWTQQQALASANVGAGGLFGQAVALNPQDLVIGAPGNSRAFVYTPVGSLWGAEQELLAPGIGASSDFGRSVDLSLDRLIVGAPEADGVVATSGSAHVFRRTLGVWAHEQTLTGAGGGAGDEFGWSVAIEGPLALVGALSADLLASNAGAAWPFVLDGGIWTPPHR
ncbi:MAG: FG-GAP repeat protein [Planctomycetota bacterium]|nr:FG-GAP repeat protein [Planctomycetota bacterium]